MARILYISGIVFILSAFVLNLLTSISLPYLSSLDITRANFSRDVTVSEANNTGITQLRLGVWSPCFYNQADQKICFASHHGYKISVADNEGKQTIVVGSSWTQGLVVHCIATVLNFVALVTIAATLFASLASFLAGLLTLIAFAIDIALFVYLRHQLNKLPNVRANTVLAPGFWMTLVSFILLITGACTLCLGRHKDRSARSTSISTPKKSFWTKSFF